MEQFPFLKSDAVITIDLGADLVAKLQGLLLSLSTTEFKSRIEQSGVNPLDSRDTGTVALYRLLQQLQSTAIAQGLVEYREFDMHQPV